MNLHRAYMVIIALALAAVMGGFLLLRPNPAPPIRIGVLHSLSGTMAVSERPLVDAVRLAVEEINAAGGLLGRLWAQAVRDAGTDAPELVNRTMLHQSTAAPSGISRHPPFMEAGTHRQGTFGWPVRSGVEFRKSTAPKSFFPIIVRNPGGGGG